jgi:hypothetical protein
MAHHPGELVRAEQGNMALTKGPPQEESVCLRAEVRGSTESGDKMVVDDDHVIPHGVLKQKWLRNGAL